MQKATPGCNYRRFGNKKGRQSTSHAMDAHTGDDGITRVKEVKAVNEVFKRPIDRLALLPVDTDPNYAMLLLMAIKNQIKDF